MGFVLAKKSESHPGPSFNFFGIAKQSKPEDQGIVSSKTTKSDEVKRWLEAKNRHSFFLSERVESAMA